MLHPMMPMTDWIADAMRIMMEVTQAMGCTATAADHALCHAALGRAPRRHIDFATAIARGDV